MKVNLKILVFLSAALASSGDHLDVFQNCVSHCVNSRCPSSVGLLALVGWDCRSNCDYLCQQTVTDAQQLANEPIHQYHGKWPFRRIFGVQEPASVIFSMLNFVPHYLMFKFLNQPQNRGLTGYMKPYYYFSTFVGMNTWLWSSVFHLRDTPVTEKLDYFSAINQLMFAVFVAMVRAFKLYLPSRKVWRYTLLVTLFGYYACHVYYLSFIKFNYHYNMMVGIVLAVAQGIVFSFLSLQLYFKSREASDLLLLAFILLTFAASSMELNDFEPIKRMVDSHSLWHLGTVFPTFLFYKWVKFDLYRAQKQTGKFVN